MHTAVIDEQYWENRWKGKNTQWDIGFASPPIIQFLQTYPDKDAAILIPGCGNAYEASWLLDNGFTNVTLLDISRSALTSAQKQLGEHQSIKYVPADFFDFKGSFDLILEQTFFCALPIDRRIEYCVQMRELLVAQGRLVGVLFDRSFDYSGPPFGGNKEEYSVIFQKYFRFKRFEACYNSIPARDGSELFINFLRK